MLLAASGFARRYGDLLERDDLIQEARLEQLLVAERQERLSDGERAEGRWRELEALLAGLPPDQAAVVRLTLLEGLSLRAAAAQLGVSRSTVHRAQRRGVEGLREGVRS